MTFSNVRLGCALAATATLLALPAAAAPARQATADDWCADAYSGRRASFCEVRESALPAAPALLDVGPARNGSIAVEGWDRNDVQVRARVVATADTDARARQIAGDVRITTDGGRVRADGPSRDEDESWWVSWRISVPRALALRLGTTNGSITVAGIASRMDLQTTNGSLRLTDLGGDVHGRTTNGSVRVQLSGRTWDGAGLTVETSNGSVRLAVPDGYAAHLETGTRNGSVHVDFPITVQGRLSRDISADLGGGGPTIRVTTRNGSVRVQRK